MKKFSEIILNAIKEDIWQYNEVCVSDIEFSEEVVNACKANYCGNYNKNWRCPPNVGELCELKRKYGAFKYAFVYTTKHAVEDSFDVEGMFAARIEHDKVDEKIYECIKERRGEILGAGACNVCQECAFPNPCRFPAKARTSVEACGINVVALAKTANVNYINGENTVTYFSVVFFDE